MDLIRLMTFMFAIIFGFVFSIDGDETYSGLPTFCSLFDSDIKCVNENNCSWNSRDKRCFTKPTGIIP
jgi:hypothetical protein